jgi:hypothetical protein
MMAKKRDYPPADRASMVSAALAAPHRYPSGDLKPTQDTARAPTLVKRIMDHAELLGIDKRVTTVLGRLHLEGVLTETETEAGYLYAEVCGTWERIDGRARRSAAAASYDIGFKGGNDIDAVADRIETMDPEAADQVRKRHQRRVRAARKRYEAAQDQIPTFPIVALTIIDEVCLNDLPVNPVHHPMLKRMLQTLAVHFGKAGQLEKARRIPMKMRPGDAPMMAEGACDAIEAWFKGEAAVCNSFEVEAGKHKSRRITGFGLRYDGTLLHKPIEIRLDGMGAGPIDAALVRAAVKRGWGWGCRYRAPAPPRPRKPILSLREPRE